VGSRSGKPATGSVGQVFDHVGIAVSDLAASKRFYRTVLSVLGVEPRAMRTPSCLCTRDEETLATRGQYANPPKTTSG
jgi:catechol 2,3-dioxygenase-like lactoylglutathione lyase family enzyme